MAMYQRSTAGAYHRLLPFHGFGDDDDGFGRFGNGGGGGQDLLYQTAAPVVGAATQLWPGAAPLINAAAQLSPLASSPPPLLQAPPATDKGPFPWVLLLGGVALYYFMK
jgi:hypothetical protein